MSSRNAASVEASVYNLYELDGLWEETLAVLLSFQEVVIIYSIVAKEEETGKSSSYLQSSLGNRMKRIPES